MDIMSMALRIQALEAENARLHETIQDMRKAEAPTFPNTMSVLKTVGFVNFLDLRSVVNLSQAHRAFKGELPVAKINLERSRLALDNARMTASQYHEQRNEHIEERNRAFKILARMWRSGWMPEVYTNELMYLFNKTGYTNEAVERLADDGLGPMPDEMLSDSEEEEEVDSEDLDTEEGQALMIARYGMRWWR
jgi:hypothetical protein